MSTIFKKIIDKEIPAKIVYEDDLCLAFYDIQPVSSVHILVIPKKEIINLDYVQEEDEKLLGHIQLVISKIAKDFKLNEKGYRVVTNINEYAGQSVFHLHYHIIGGNQLGKMC